VLAAIGVVVIRIAAVDDDVAGGEEWFELSGDDVDRLTGFDEQNDLARRVECGDEFFE
jgi:hypothetical protein